MAIDERRPTLLSVQRELRRQSRLAKRATARVSSKTFSGISVTGVTTAASKDVFDRDVPFMLDDQGMIEVYASFSGTMSGSGRTMNLMLVLDSTEFQILEWANVTAQNRYTAPDSFNGTTATRGSFIVRNQQISAGYHTLNFRFVTSTAGTGSASNGTVSYRFS